MPSTSAPPAKLHRPVSENDAHAQRARQLAGQLGDWFSTEFAVLWGDTGAVAAEAATLAGIDWGLWGPLAQQACQRGEVEFLADEDPALLLALPVIAARERALVAVGAFLARRPQTAAEMQAVAELLGVSSRQAESWAARQMYWPAEPLRRMAVHACRGLRLETRAAQLESQLNEVSSHLAATYEEITLIYRLTQNLKLTSDDEELVRMALGWLADVLPAAGLAVQLRATSQEALPNEKARTQPLLLVHGACPLDVRRFGELVEHLGVDATQRPVVVNRAQEQVGWPFPEIRNLILVPLAEGERLFGWLAACNHVQGADFGTVEANLLQSVAAILGIHSGNCDLYRQQAELLAGVIRALTSAIDAKDPYTRGHSDRVARVSVRLAQELGCDPETCRTIYLSGLLHDIGKIGIDDNILRKPGRLTDAEFEHIKTHVEIGYRILRDLRKMSHVLPVVLHHHESWDGRGYPYGLAGDNIPLLARIVAVADAYDAMASDRPYRPGMPQERLEAVLRDGAGKQWDARVIDAFFRARDDILRIVQREGEEADASAQWW
jgi:putative nucleotidyltransferase with HDIG domain